MSETTGETIERVARERDELEAMLCAAMTGLALRCGGHEAALSWLGANVHWKEVGLPFTTLERWWIEHRAGDRRRRAEEERRESEAKERQALLRGLTPRQRRLLGVDR